MEIVIHKAESRGGADYGWLNTRHTFSFADYYQRDRMNFGALRVLNDDIVQPGMGFSTHGHSNMEIISVPIYGELAHQDSTGSSGAIHKNEIQVMSAGKGIRHSEKNPSASEALNFLQIWVLPKLADVKPQYNQKVYSENERKDRLQLIVSPDGENDSLAINQDAYFHLSSVSAGKSIQYTLKNKRNGVYVFVIYGLMKIEGNILRKRDGIGIWETDSFTVEAENDLEVLFMEVPMYI